MNWPGRRREEGGFEPIAHIRVIQVLPVADNWIDEDAFRPPTITTNHMGNVGPKLCQCRANVDEYN